jgi:hypothetical protein
VVVDWQRKTRHAEAETGGSTDIRRATMRYQALHGLRHPSLRR